MMMVLTTFRVPRVISEHQSSFFPVSTSAPLFVPPPVPKHEHASAPLLVPGVAMPSAFSGGCCHSCRQSTWLLSFFDAPAFAGGAGTCWMDRLHGFPFQCLRSAGLRNLS